MQGLWVPVNITNLEDHEFCDGNVWNCQRCGYVVRTVREASKHMIGHGIECTSFELGSDID